MKKMTFALACASAVAAFAVAQDDAVISSVNFELYQTIPFTGLSLKGDNGSEGNVTDSFWLYDGGTSGATDGSTVKAYDPAITGNANYLELSTEGGTLWRSINTLADSETLGAAQEIPASTGLYVDTMVQFTPTEDGGAPELGAGDKLAIWLNVDSTGDKPVTNLCVRAGRVYREGSEAVEAKTFVLKGKEVDAGTWYRLTVKTIPDVTKAISQGERSTGVTGYQISLDGTVLSTDDTVFDASYLDWAYDDWLEDADQALLQSGTVFAGLDGFVTSATLQAVGFKGSGAIDNLQFTTEDPGADPAETIDLTISAVHATVAGIEQGKVEVGSNLTFTVTAETGYNVTAVTINGNTVTADGDNYTYTVTAGDTAVAVVVTTEAIPQIDWDHPDTSAGTTAGDMFKLTGPIAAADGAKVATWAKAKGVDFADASTTIKMDAFLLNCANTDEAITTAKAAFKIVSIEQDAKGAWVAKVTGDTGDGQVYGNGYVVIKGSATVDGEYTLPTTAEAAKFFKAFLVLEAPAVE